MPLHSQILIKWRKFRQDRPHIKKELEVQNIYFENCFRKIFDARGKNTSFLANVPA